MSIWPTRCCATATRNAFALLYRLLHRLRRERGVLDNPADPLMARLNGLAKAVRRDSHKMRAFVRFREVPGDGPRRRFAAWFEPEHLIVPRNAPFFARRFADMDWTILTPGNPPSSATAC